MAAELTLPVEDSLKKAVGQLEIQGTIWEDSRLLLSFCCVRWT